MMIHYTTNGRLTECGTSTQDVVHSDEVELVAGCIQCLAAAAAAAACPCPGGCGGAHECRCFAAGYNAGLSIAFGLRPL